MIFFVLTPIIGLAYIKAKKANDEINYDRLATPLLPYKGFYHNSDIANELIETTDRSITILFGKKGEKGNLIVTEETKRSKSIVVKA